MEYKANFKNAYVFVKELKQTIECTAENAPVFLQYGYTHLFKDEYIDNKIEPEYTSVNGKRTKQRRSTKKVSVPVHERSDARADGEIPAAGNNE